MNYIQTNILERVYYIRHSNGAATCFLFDANESEYIITAKHVVPNVNSGDSISLLLDKEWKDFKVDYILHHQEKDISILKINHKFNCTTKISYSFDGIIYGQDVFFFGFPYGMVDSKSGRLILEHNPIPFVKKGVLSACSFGSGDKIVIDGHCNFGFSGGPLVFYNEKKREWFVGGVVIEYHYESEPIFNMNGSDIGLHYNENTGIMFAEKIEYALDLIKMNLGES